LIIISNDAFSKRISVIYIVRFVDCFFFSPLLIHESYLIRFCAQIQAWTRELFALSVFLTRLYCWNILVRALPLPPVSFVDVLPTARFTLLPFPRVSLHFLNPFAVSLLRFSRGPLQLAKLFRLCFFYSMTSQAFTTYKSVPNGGGSSVPHD